MGKKDKKDKKHKGIEKTALKTEKKLEKKTKKLLKEKGEEDVESLIAQFQEQDRKRQQVVEEKCDPPSLRCNMTLTVHPEKDILMMFGGEYFDGSKTFLYNDLFLYHIGSNEWSLLKAPNPPGPRCSHQAVALHQLGGQLWIFGGEFANPTQTQFYHYKDLWMFSLKERTWQKMSATGGPSARSGHRMVACQKMLFVFGGFHESSNDFKYFNDLHAFNVETYKWMKLEISGIPPSPRSGCVMAVTHDQNRIIVFGGYSKERIKRDVDRGQVHTDMFALSVEAAGKRKEESTESEKLKLKWQPVKQSGSRPSPRSSCSLVVTAPNTAMLFGGVFDQEEDEETMCGEFFDDLYCLELDKGKWHEVILRKPLSEKEPKKRRRKEKAAADVTSVDDDDDDQSASSDDESATDVKEIGDSVMSMDIAESAAATQSCDVPSSSAAASVTTYDDGVFTVKIAAPQPGTGSSSAVGGGACSGSQHVRGFVPCPRMNPVLAVRSGVLYLYGGAFEDGDRLVTLSDFYSLDTKKMDEWKTIIPLNADVQPWFESESSSGDEGDDDGEDEETEGATGGCEMTTADDDEEPSSSEEPDEES